jgi:hypothetical protein
MDTIQQAESLVRRLPDVAACRIDVDAGGRVVAVHVMTMGEPDPGLAADVATLLTTETPLQVDVSQVRVSGPESSPPESGAALEVLEHDGRVMLVAIRTHSTHESTRVEVDLELAGEITIGYAEARGGGAAPEILAQACLDALEKLCTGRVALRFVAMQQTTAGPLDLVTVVVQEAIGRDTRWLVGTARNDGDLSRAAAYAALDSFNRRLGRILALPPKTYRIG